MVCEQQEQSQHGVFSNQQIVHGSLPLLEQQKLNPISPKYRTINLCIAALVTLLLLSVVSTLRFQSWFSLPDNLVFAYPFVAAAVVGLGVVWFIYHYFADTKIKYAVREQDISKESGLIFRGLFCQPILRVQHVEVKRGPFDRWAGLAKLQVFSAGGEMHTFEIPGLPLTQAQQLRQFILDHKDVSAR